MQTARTYLFACVLLFAVAGCGLDFGDSTPGAEVVTSGDELVDETGTSLPGDPEVTLPSESTTTTTAAQDTFTIGDKGRVVEALQQHLDDLGYDVGEIDGVYGEQTALAVKAFQADSELSETGVADAATVEALFNTEPDLDETPPADVTTTTETPATTEAETSTTAEETTTTEEVTTTTEA